MGGIAALPSKGRSVINIRANFAVFYGKVDQKRDPGWYWTEIKVHAGQSSSNNSPIGARARRAI
jgi:hypothetical protein